MSPGGVAATTRGAPGRKRVSRAVREQQMLAAAARIFGERGFHAASMDEIAAAAGITKPMLYAYFDSKDGLFAACAEQAAADLRDGVREAAGPELRPDQRLWKGILTVFRFVDEHREGWALLYPDGGERAGPIGAAARQARAAMEDLLTTLFAEQAKERGVDEQAAAHVGALADGFTGATIAMASAWLRNPDEPRELQALRLMNLAWMGFGDLIEGNMWLPEAA